MVAISTTPAQVSTPRTREFVSLHIDYYVESSLIMFCQVPAQTRTTTPASRQRESSELSPIFSHGQRAARRDTSKINHGHWRSMLRLASAVVPPAQVRRGRQQLVRMSKSNSDTDLSHKAAALADLSFRTSLPGSHGACLAGTGTVTASGIVKSPLDRVPASGQDLGSDATVAQTAKNLLLGSRLRRGSLRS